MPATFTTTPIPATDNALLLEMQVDEMVNHLESLTTDPIRRLALRNAVGGVHPSEDARRPYLRLAVAMMASLSRDDRSQFWPDVTSMPGYQEGVDYTSSRARNRFTCEYCDYRWQPRVGTPVPAVIVCDSCTDTMRTAVRADANRYRDERGRSTL